MFLFNELNRMGMATTNNIGIKKDRNNDYICPNDSTPLQNKGFTSMDYLCPNCGLFVRGPVLVK